MPAGELAQYIARPLLFQMLRSKPVSSSSSTAPVAQLIEVPAVVLASAWLIGPEHWNVLPSLTDSVAFAAAWLSPLSVLRPPAGIVLRKLPTAGAVTDTVTVQLPEAGICAPELRLTLLLPAAAVTEPPVQVVDAPGVRRRPRPQAGCRRAPHRASRASR